MCGRVFDPEEVSEIKLNPNLKKKGRKTAPYRIAKFCRRAQALVILIPS
jgi:hypothetical protein